MKQIPLSLRRTDDVKRQITGWLLNTPDPLQLLNEVAAWPVAQSALRCLFLPGYAADQRAAACLVISTSPFPTGFRPAHAVPFGYLMDHLLAPIDAELNMAVRADEWHSLLPAAESVYVWRGSGELVAFEAADQLTLVELLTASVTGGQHWSYASEGTSYVTRLLSVVSSSPAMTFDEMEAAWRQELGQPGDYRSLDKLPDETGWHWTEWISWALSGPRRLWQRLARSSSTTTARDSDFRGITIPFRIYMVIVSGFLMLMIFILLQNPSRPFSWKALTTAIVTAIVLSWLFRPSVPDGNATREPSPPTQPPAKPRPPGWFWQRLQRWWMDQARSSSANNWSLSSMLNQANQRQRDREVQRLLHMLDQDPDQGLKFAIPFGGDMARGIAAASNWLSAHGLNFSLGDGGGGLAADYWNLSDQHRTGLLNRYRDLAAREIRMGRHRRAAYIYARLIGDWHSAASALVAGHNYREAAVIYHKRLKNIPEAARLYELGGHFDAALQLHVEAKSWVAAGDLCARQERQTEARSYYQQAVDEALARSDVPAAAMLVEEKLDDVDQALALLAGTWPDHARADDCLFQWFQLTERHDRIPAALERVQQLSRTNSTAAALKVLPGLSRVQQKYARGNVSHEAAEATLRIVAQHLPSASSTMARQLTIFLPPLAASDRLLTRDCQRFADTLLTAERKQPRPATQPLKLLKRYLTAAIPLGGPPLAASFGWVLLQEREPRKPQQLLLREWNGETHLVEFPLCKTPARLLGVLEQQRQILVRMGLPAARTASPGQSDAWSIVSPSFLHDSTVVVAAGRGVIAAFWSDNDQDQWMISRFSESGSLLKSYGISNDFLTGLWDIDVMRKQEANGLSPSMHFRNDGSLLNLFPVHDELTYGLYHQSDGVQTWSGEIAGREVVCSPDITSRRVLICRNDSLVVMEDVCRQTSAQFQYHNLHAPRATFVTEHLIAAVDEECLMLGSAHERQLIDLQRHKAASPLAIASCGDGRISILRSDGSLELWGRESSNPATS